ncbi:MAG: hypothetical protein ACRDO8_13340, partial [Nocardioidaceae bacterium]
MRRSPTPWPVRLPVLVGTAVLVASCTSASTDHPPGPTAPSPPSPSSAAADRSPGPLAGSTIVIDPGHQLGNARHPRRIAEPVDAGGFRKPCNTTGTATDGGYPEATFTFAVARA